MRRVLLLAISLWMRLKLAESPHFAKLQQEGELSHAPLREAFADRTNLKRVLIAFFGIAAYTGALLLMGVVLFEDRELS